jgi:hypothetical protein
MNAYLYINFVSGLGDTYTTIMSALQSSIELENFGYNTFLIINTTRNNYLPEHLELDCLFDFSGFKNKVIYNIPLDNEGNPVIQNLKLNKLKQDQNSYSIYVDSIIPELYEYQSYIFGHTEINKLSKRPTCNMDIISLDVKNIADSFIGNFSNIVTLHYRAMDGLGNSEEYVNGRIGRFENFINEHKDKNILVCSNGKLIRDLLKNKHSNVITFNFTYNELELYPCYDIYTKPKFSEDIFIRHSQEILAEMVMIKYSEKILSISPFLSNFVTYGVLNNTHKKDYSELFNHES